MKGKYEREKEECDSITAGAYEARLRKSGKGEGMVERAFFRREKALCLA